jgi:hypothetical protein
MSPADHFANSRKGLVRDLKKRQGGNVPSDWLIGALLAYVDDEEIAELVGAATGSARGAG